ncbi:MAG: recombination protein O N-terminal domain-containing protein [Candidatus Paceibacterota bacterium]|jgi:recombinational DNA repair protein (RecF pathway)
MRHKYETSGIVLSRTHVGEATTFVTLLTPELGLVHARAQSLRKSGAKLASSLPTLAESSVVLVRGKEGWRIAGAVLSDNWFLKLPHVGARTRAARVSGLLLRLVAGEAHDTALYPVLRGFLTALSVLPEEEHEAAEILTVLRILSALGLDTAPVENGAPLLTSEALVPIRADRTGYIARINNGIAASGL